MIRRSRQPKPTSVQVLVVGAAFLFLFAFYVAAMRMNLEKSHLASGDLGDQRDEAYLAIHLGVTALAAVVGTLLGKWLNGLGFAFMALFVAVMLSLMLVATLGSQHLACSSGRNDVLRHWTCGASHSGARGSGVRGQDLNRGAADAGGPDGRRARRRHPS